MDICLDFVLIFYSKRENKITLVFNRSKLVMKLGKTWDRKTTHQNTSNIFERVFQTFHYIPALEHILTDCSPVRIILQLYFTATSKNRIVPVANLCKLGEFLFNLEIKHINLLCGLLAPETGYTREYYINTAFISFPKFGTKIKSLE